MLNIGKCDVSPRLLAINPTSTYIARPLPSKIQSRSWDAGSPPHQAAMPRYLKTSPNSGEHSLPMEVSAHTLESLVLHHHINIIDECVMPILLYDAENWVESF